MRRFRTVLFLLAVLVIGSSSFIVSQASARASEPVRAIYLSASGFEQAHAVSFSQDGKYLAVGGTSGVYLFDPQSLSIIEFIRTHAWARSVAFVPGSDTLAAGLFDNSIRLWNVPDGQLIRTLSDPKGWVRSVSFSADGTLLAAASDDNTIRVWNVQDGSPVLLLDKNTNGVRAVALSPDGTLMAGALDDNLVRVWKIPSGELIYTLRGHGAWVRCLAFSPDGQTLASAGFDKTIRLWDMTTGRWKQTLEGHASSVLGVTFSPDGEILASASVDQTVRLWNARDGSPLRILQGHTNFVYAVAFSPDGQTLASGSADNTVRLWDMHGFGEADPSIELPTVTTPSDCRACHHRRGQLEPAPVVELSCENCHAGGISSAWCNGFPRSSQIEKTPIAYNAVAEIPGVPINDRNLAVLIASPGNGETLYVRGNFMAPEFISGKVFTANPESLSKVTVHLDIVSNDETTASLVTQPSETGTFTFNVAINSGSPPPHLSRPGTRQCLVCHGDFVPQADLPKGDVHVVVTATTRDGQQATDDRWIRVDASHEASPPVRVLNAETGDPLQGLSLEANAILYQWRSRFATATSDSNGQMQLHLDALTQARTTYDLSIPPQIINGTLYSSSEPVTLDLEPDADLHKPVTLAVNAVTGQILGGLDGEGISGSLEDTRVWAVQLPAGPAYQTSLNEKNKFVFERIPISQYIVAPDESVLSKQGLYTTPHSVDLFDSPVSNLSFSVEEGRWISGKVTTTNGEALPFGWVTVGGTGSVWTIDPGTAQFALSNFPADASFVTFTAPGYYSLPQSVKKSTETLDVQLVPRPETRAVPWGTGQVIVPPETNLRIDGLTFNLEYGWIWGRNPSSQALDIHVQGMDIHLSSGKFALEQPPSGTGWLYIPSGKAEVTYHGRQSPVRVGSGQMIALLREAQPFPIETVVVSTLHTTLQQAPVAEIIEPSLRARLQNRLARTGIGAMQTITFITYILSLVTLFTIPIVVLFSFWKKRRTSSDSQEKP